CFCLERLSALFLAAISSRSADLAHKVHWTLCFKPNHALKEFETRYAISSSVKALFALRFKRSGRLARLRGEKYSNLAQHQIGSRALRFKRKGR
ncbi:hypothetical protein QP194_24455, partial [Escherichia coli]|nr:hypothetical protein [Escherichia coli]